MAKLTNSHRVINNYIQMDARYGLESFALLSMSMNYVVIKQLEVKKRPRASTQSGNEKDMLEKGIVFHCLYP